MRTPWILAALLLSACAAELSVPLQATITCHEDAACPEGRVCAVDVERCVPAGEACVERVDGVHRSVERGRRCSAAGGADGVCLEAECRLSFCGDGVVDPNRLEAPEACDEGALNSDERPDACRADCHLPRCGDGVVDSGEACDDANDVEQDACLSSCLLNRCGDGILDPQAEECDDGNDLEQDACRSTCVRNVCGDAVLDPVTEPCDDGNQNPSDGCDRCQPTAWRPRLLVGQAEGAGIGTAMALEVPYSVALDGRGGLFVADSGHHRVLRLDVASGRVVVWAGTGESGISGEDGEPATRAQLREPAAVAVDSAGDLFVADTSCRVRRVDATTGRVRTVAGIAELCGYEGDGGPATLAQVGQSFAIAVDGRGSLYIADGVHHVVRRVEAATGLIETLVGTGTCLGGPTEGLAEQVELCNPAGLATTLSGFLYVVASVRGADGLWLRDEIRRVDLSTRQVSTLGPCPGMCLGLAAREDGTLAVASGDQRVWQISADGSPSVLAGDGTSGFSGDGGPALAASLQDPVSVAWADDGGFFFADAYNHRVRRVDAAGTIRTVVGNGSTHAGGCVTNLCREFYDLAGLAVYPDGRILVAGGLAHVVLRIDPLAGTLETIAGTHMVPGLDGDGGPAAQATLFNAADVALDPDGNIFIAELGNRRVRRVDAATGVITTLLERWAGAPLRPTAVAFDAARNLYVGDLEHHVILRVAAVTGEVSVFAGSGSAGFSGDGGPATDASLRDTQGLAFDPAGRLIIVDAGNKVLRRVGSDGVIETIAGIPGVEGFAGDGGPPLSAKLGTPRMVAVSPAGEIYLADRGERRVVRRISADLSTISTVAGGEEPISSGDGGPAAAARFVGPSGVAFDQQGGLLVADGWGRRVRRISPDLGGIVTLLGPVTPQGDGPLEVSRLGAPGALTQVALADGSAPWLVADGRTGRVRAVDLEAGRVETRIGYPNGLPAEGVDAWFSRLLGAPLGIAADPDSGVVYVSESTGHTIRRVDTAATPWTITTLAGRFEQSGFGADRLYGPRGLLLDPARGVLFVADTDNHVVRAIALESGTFVTVAGTPGVRGFVEGGSATTALLDSPQALALGSDGSLYVADTGNHRVRRITDPLGPAPGIEAVTGNGVQATTGEGSPASSFPVDSPVGLAVDGHGNLFVSGSSTVRVVVAGADGLATGEGSVGIVYGREPRDGPLESVTHCLSGLQVTDGPEGGEDTRLLLLDSCLGYLIALDRERL